MKRMVSLLSAVWLAVVTTGCAGAFHDNQPTAANDYRAGVDDEQAAPQSQGDVPIEYSEQSLAAAAPGGDVVVGSGDATTYDDTDPSALSDFREPLEPYGTWVDDGDYGTVWVPREDVVGRDFVPYSSAGHWTYDDEYVWVSDYSWGWIPFHYGRWVQSPVRGWVWIPGRTYAGAWVTWRVGPAGYGYVGWAPLAPSWYWYNGYAYGFGAGYAWQYHYGYCHRDYLFRPAVHTHVVRGPDARQHDARTSSYVAAQPSVNERTPASPTVDGRVAARPSLSSRAVAGPSPRELGIGSVQLAKPTASNLEGMARAKAFSSPATATALGARAPSSNASALGAERTQSGPSRDQARAAVESRPSLREGALAPVATGPRFVAPRPAQANERAMQINPQGAVRSTSPAASAPGYLGRSSGSSSVATAPRYQGVEPRSIPRPLDAPRVQNAAPSFSARSPGITTQRAPSNFSSAQRSAPPASNFSSAQRSMQGSSPSFSSSSRSSMPSRSTSSPSFSSSSRSTSPSRSFSSSPSRSFSSSSSSRSFSSSPSRSFSSPSRSSAPSMRSSAPSRPSSSMSRGRR